MMPRIPVCPHSAHGDFPLQRGGIHRQAPIPGPPGTAGAGGCFFALGEKHQPREARVFLYCRMKVLDGLTEAHYSMLTCGLSLFFSS